VASVDPRGAASPPPFLPACGGRALFRRNHRTPTPAAPAPAPLRLAVLIALATSAHAAPFLWDGGGVDNNWSTANNWISNTPPSTAVNDYGFSGSVGLASNADGAAAWAVSSLVFTPYAGAFTLTGTTLNLGATGIVNKSTANQTIANAIVLQASTIFSTATTGGLSLGGLISGASGGINKTGPGTLTLAGANTFAGLTTISAGTIALGAAGGATNTPLGTTAGGTLVKGTGAALDLSGFTLGTAEAVTLIGTGVDGTGALTNSGAAASFSGVVTLSSNTATNGAAIGGSGDITLSAGISGDFNLTKVGTGTLTLSGASTRAAGNTSVDLGTLRLGSATALGTTATPLILRGGTLALALNTSVSAYATTLTAGSTITTGRATAGAGVTQTLGTLSANGSTLVVNTQDTTVTSGTAGLTFGTTTLTGNPTFNVVNGTAAATVLTLGALNDTGTPRSLTKTGSGTLTLANAATSLTNGTAVTVSGGTLNSNNATALGSLANLTVTGAGATFGVGATQTVGALNGAGSGTVALGANTLTVGSAANNLTSAFTGTVTGTGGLTKAGNGSLTLTGNNTYSGLTTISAGTLKLGSAGDATNTPLGTTGAGTTVSAGGALDLNGFTLGTAEALTLNGTGVRSGGALTNTGAAATWSGTVALGAATSIGGTGNILLTGVVSGANPLTKVGTNTLTLQGANTNSSTVTILGGGLTLSGASGALTSATGYTLRSGGTLTLDNSTNNNTNRLASVAFGANGGNVVFTHSGAAATNYAETTGTLSVNSGGLNLTTSQAAVGQTSGLIFGAGAPTRAAGGTVMFSGLGFGASNRNTVAFGAAPTLSANSNIIPWAAINDNGTYSFATYNVTGFTSVKPVTSTNTGQAAWANTINARPTADVTLSAARTVGSLILDSGIDLLAPTADRNLTIASGALMQTGGSSIIGATATLENILTFGAVEGILTTIGTLTLQRGNAAAGIIGTAGITKTGPGTFINETTNANSGLLTINDGTYRGVTRAGAISGGGVTANQGTLEVASDTSTTFTNTATTINGDFTLKPDRATSGSGSGLTQTIGTVTLNNAATLTVAAGANVTTAPITLSTGAVTLGATNATINTSGLLTALTLASITGAGNNLTVTGDGNTAVTGAITTGTGTLIKEGSGNLTLNGVNTFTGLTTVNAGTLTLGQATNTFAATAPITVNGGILALGANSDTLGAVTLQAGSITGSTGVLTPASLDAQSGTVSAIIGGAGTFTKSTTGTVTLTGANTYTGATTIQTGTLAIGNGGTTGSIAAGSAIVNNGTLSFNRSNALTVANTLSGNGDLVQAGTGTLTLSGTNTTYAGAVTVNSGSTLKLTSTTALGSTNTAGTTVTSGGVLQLDAGATPANGTLTLGGTGIANGGALVGVATGNNRWAGNITLTADTTVTNNGAGGLALGTTSSGGNFRGTSPPAQTPVDTFTTSLGAHTLTLNGTGTIYLNGRLTGTGNINVSLGSNTAIAEYDAYMNTFTGTTTVTRGVLNLNSIANNYPGDPSFSSFFGINGPLVIGDGHATNTATFNSGALGRPDQINVTKDVTLFSNGTWNLSSTQTIASLTMNGGAIDLGTSGGLYLDGNLTTNAAATAATISGPGTTTLSLTPKQGGAITVSNATRTFTVADGAAASDLTLDVTINNGSFIKAGPGTMTILNSNIGGYEGTTTVNGGILNIRNAAGLGQASNVDDNSTTVNGTGTTTLAGTTVGTGTANGSLQLQHATGLNVAVEKLTLNGTGYLNNGALQNVSGNNTWSGIVTLGSAARIQSDANTLGITTPSIAGPNTDLDIRGTGNTTLTATLDTGSGVLTKNGTGTLTLNGVGLSTYTGDTLINTGVVSLQTAGGLGATTAGTTVASGAALELSNATYGGNLVTSQEPLTLAGTGIAGTGALLNRAGTNTFSGLVSLNGVSTVAGATLITAVTGQSLTLAGGTSATTQALTVGTTAENGNVVISGNAANGTSELSKNGSGSLTFSGTLTQTGNVNLNLGTLAFTGTAATVDQVHLLGGAGSTLSVGAGTTLTTDEFDSSPLSTLNIASGGTVISTYNVGNTTFSGQITGTGGAFKALGTGQVTFDRTIINPGLSVYLGGTSIGTNLTPLTFTLAGATTLQFGSLHITGDTILDFGDSAASVLSSANLIIDAGVKITVQNWISMTDAWYATSALVQNNNGVITSGSLNRTGSTPENQITFTGFSNNSTAWINQTAYPAFNQYEIRPVPEPSTYGAILVSGCGALLAYRRFRRRPPAAAPQTPPDGGAC
jgi:autotransporter-associated beta strand protein